ncbi:response regulator transcription factor [Winogradskya consettensis]|uniref:DNA-binding response regulator n=1 Tax=Winogradskya consettensis TaxID=113560 RepID=A0A919SML8_9ACTN|nr:response regulator transcription factor [Actinoplanes consettensis]GIM74284.1 DNA-binding response regulator [Actinoplanes consettensis]
MTAPLRLLIADDQTSVRAGLVALLGTVPDIEVVGAAADGAEAVALTAALEPDAILMDLRMPVMDGVEATARIARTHPSVAVVVLTTYADDDSVLTALSAGARGYLTKDASRADLARALHTAVAGQVTLAGPAQQALLAAATPAAPGHPTRPVGLTDRENQILQLIAEGLPNREIAARLFIGNATVKTHVNHIFAKLGVTTRQAARDRVEVDRNTRPLPAWGPDRAR